MEMQASNLVYPRSDLIACPFDLLNFFLLLFLHYKKELQEKGGASEH